MELELDNLLEDFNKCYVCFGQISDACMCPKCHKLACYNCILTCFKERKTEGGIFEFTLNRGLSNSNADNNIRTTFYNYGNFPLGQIHSTDYVEFSSNSNIVRNIHNNINNRNYNTSNVSNNANNLNNLNSDIIYEGKCPHCRHEMTLDKVLRLKTFDDLFNFIKTQQNNKCCKHNMQYLYYCLECKVRCCSDCIYDDIGAEQFYPNDMNNNNIKQIQIASNNISNSNNSTELVLTEAKELNFDYNKSKQNISDLYKTNQKGLTEIIETREIKETAITEDKKQCKSNSQINNSTIRNSISHSNHLNKIKKIIDVYNTKKAEIQNETLKLSYKHKLLMNIVNSLDSSITTVNKIKKEKEDDLNELFDRLKKTLKQNVDNHLTKLINSKYHIKNTVDKIEDFINDTEKKLGKLSKSEFVNEFDAIIKKLNIYKMLGEINNENKLLNRGSDSVLYNKNNLSNNENENDINTLSNRSNKDSENNDDKEMKDLEDKEKNFYDAFLITLINEVDDKMSYKIETNRISINKSIPILNTCNSFCNLGTQVKTQSEKEHSAYLGMINILQENETENPKDNDDYNNKDDSKNILPLKSLVFNNHYDKILIDLPPEITPYYKKRTINIKEINNIIKNNQEIVYSEQVYINNVIWRLKIYPFGTGSLKNEYLSVFLEVIDGVPNKETYDYIIELVHPLRSDLNFSRNFSSDFKNGECWGSNKFINIEEFNRKKFIQSVIEVKKEVISIINEYTNNINDDIWKHKENSGDKNIIYEEESDSFINDSLIINLLLRPKNYRRLFVEQDEYIKQLEKENKELKSKVN